MKPLLPLLPFAAIGGWSVVVAIREVLRARAARNWPSVWGTILESQRAHDPESQSRITYTYSVTGQAYTSSRVMFGDWLGYGLSANAASERYPLAGQPVMVRYAPHRPSDAVLEPGASIGVVTGVLLGTIFLVVGTAPIWWPWVEPHVPEGNGTRADAEPAVAADWHSPASRRCAPGRLAPAAERRRPLEDWS